MASTRERRPLGSFPAGAARAVVEDEMSLHPTHSGFTMRPVRSAARRSSADPQLFTAVVLLLAVLIADALLILSAAPSLADLGSFYVSTT